LFLWSCILTWGGYELNHENKLLEKRIEKIEAANKDYSDTLAQYEATSDMAYQLYLSKEQAKLGVVWQDDPHYAARLKQAEKAVREGGVRWP
jgi:hypothetical protein